MLSGHALTPWYVVGWNFCCKASQQALQQAIPIIESNSNQQVHLLIKFFKLLQVLIQDKSLVLRHLMVDFLVFSMLITIEEALGFSNSSPR